MKKAIVIILGLILSLALITSGCAPEAGGQKAEEFFEGKTIRIICPSRPGGAPDTAARVVAEFLPEYTGGYAVVETMEGGRQTKGLNYVWQAEPDGLTLGVAPLTVPLMKEMTEEAGVLWETDKYTHLSGLAEQGFPLLVAKDGPYKSIDDLKKAKGLKFVMGQPTDTIALRTFLVIEALGLDAKVIIGPGMGERTLAVKRGQMDAFVAPLGVYVRNKDSLVPLLVVETERQGAVPDAPAIVELAKLTKKQQTVLEALCARSLESFIGPPGMPEDRTEFLRQAFEKMQARDDFLQKMLKGFAPPMVNRTPEEISELISNLKKNN